MKGKADSVDILILKELRDNSKRSIRELAQRLKIHPNTLMQRIKKLERDGLIQKYVAEIDYSKLGYDLHAFVSIKVNKDAKSKWNLVEELRTFKDIAALYATTGSYDIVAIVKTQNSNTLTALISELNKKPYVVETNTTLILYPFKHAYEFNPL
ncbi:Lrp/AsnC family transcriptional regulator [Candidatus Micrarchaeota archaeon]|nr:Lrp/AsnC family transcriptional regulator [Candidatus Micrarchaeota archaeon]